MHLKEFKSLSATKFAEFISKKLIFFYFRYLAFIRAVVSCFSLAVTVFER